MALKLSVFLLVVVAAFVAGHENEKRQSGPNFNEYFNKFQEHMKPFVGSLPQLPNGIGSGSFPSFPGFGGSSSSGSQTPSKRQASPYTFGEWFNNLSGGPISGNLPFKPPPPFGNLPFGGVFGGGSGSTDTSENQES